MKTSNGQGYCSHYLSWLYNLILIGVFFYLSLFSFHHIHKSWMFCASKTLLCPLHYWLVATAVSLWSIMGQNASKARLIIGLVNSASCNTFRYFPLSLQPRLSPLFPQMAQWLKENRLKTSFLAAFLTKLMLTSWLSEPPCVCTGCVPAVQFY